MVTVTLVSTSGHPDKIYLGTAEGDLKKKYDNYIITIFFFKWDTNE